MYRKVFLNESWFFSNWQVLFSFDFEKEWKGQLFEIKHMGKLDIYALWDLALEGSPMEHWILFLRSVFNLSVPESTLPLCLLCNIHTHCFSVTHTHTAS